MTRVNHSLSLPLSLPWDSIRSVLWCSRIDLHHSVLFEHNPVRNEWQSLVRCPDPTIDNDRQPMQLHSLHPERWMDSDWETCIVPRSRKKDSISALWRKIEDRRTNHLQDLLSEVMIDEHGFHAEILRWIHRSIIRWGFIRCFIDRQDIYTNSEISARGNVRSLTDGGIFTFVEEQTCTEFLKKRHRSTVRKDLRRLLTSTTISQG